MRYVALVLVTVALWACPRSIPPCSTDADCPAGGFCHRETRVCFPIKDGGTPDGGEPDGGADAGVDFVVSVDPASIGVAQGESGSVKVRVERRGMDGAVSVGLDAPPSGVSADPLTIAGAEGTLVVRVLGGTPLGTHELTIRAAAGALERRARLSLTITRGADIAVVITSPSSPHHTNGTVSFQVQVTGGVPDTVELLNGGVPFATLQAPYSYGWDTRSVAEGQHTITARATKAGVPSTSAAVTVVVDRTAPTITSRLPAPGDSNVAVRARIEATFSEPLLASSVTDASVALLNGTAAVPKTLMLSSDGRTLMLIPNTMPTAPATYSVAFSSGVTDGAGNPLAPASPNWTWTYPDWLQIGGALSATSGNTPAQTPSLVVDSAGNPIVAWSESDGMAKNVYVYRWTGSAWQQMGTARSRVGGSTDATEPQLAIDGNNVPSLIWVETTTSNKRIFIDRWNGSGWSTLVGPLQGGTYSDAYVGSPCTTVNAQGNPIAAWGEYLGAGFAIFAGMWNGASWVNFGADPSPRGFNPAYPSCAIDSSAAFVLAGTSFYESPTEERMTFVSRYSGTSWSLLGSDLNAVAANGTHAVKPSVAQGGGALFVAWDENDTSSIEGVFVSQWSGSSWMSVGGRVSSPTSKALRPSLRVDSTAKPVVAWTSVSNSESKVFVSRWNGASWIPIGSPISAVGGIGTDAQNASLALTAQGLPVVAFQESSAGIDDVYVFSVNQ